MPSSGIMSTAGHGPESKGPTTGGGEIEQQSSRGGSERGDSGEEDGCGTGRVVCQHHSLPGHRRSGEGELRSSRTPHGLRTNGTHPV